MTCRKSKKKKKKVVDFTSGGGLALPRCEEAAEKRSRIDGGFPFRALLFIALSCLSAKEPHKCD